MFARAFPPVFKLPTWSLLRLQRLRMAFSNSDGYEPLASPLVEQKDSFLWPGTQLDFPDLGAVDPMGNPARVSEVPVTTFTIVT